MPERRRHERFRVHLPICMRTGDQIVFAETTNISRHGIFISTPDLLLPGQRLHLELSITPNWVEENVVLELCASVSWLRTHAESALYNEPSGIGINIVGMESYHAKIWNDVICALEENRKFPISIAQTKEERLFRYFIRPTSLDMLRDVQSDIFSGKLFLQTPYYHHIREPIECTLIHPFFESEFTFSGNVFSVHHAGPVTKRGLLMSVSDITPEKSQLFEQFISEPSRKEFSTLC